MYSLTDIVDHFTIFFQNGNNFMHTFLEGFRGIDFLAQP